MDSSWLEYSERSSSQHEVHIVLILSFTRSFWAWLIVYDFFLNSHYQKALQKHPNESKEKKRPLIH
jgi:hypothetical protein